jgi:hypothetical protein
MGFAGIRMPAFKDNDFGAGNEARTRDLNLGKVALYQLSYSRNNETAAIRMAASKVYGFSVRVVISPPAP